MPRPLSSPSPSRSLVTPPRAFAAVEPGPARLVASPDPLVAAALGRFAGKVAHELNNVLTAISSYGELLLEDLPHDSAAREDAVEILAATRRAAALSQALHELARPATPPVENLDLARWADVVAPQLREVLGADRSLAVDAAAPSVIVAVEGERLASAVEALVTNAREATAPGGHCTLRIERVSVRERDPEFPASLGSGRYARITILDDGCGMDPAVLASAAEPLFGTRRGARRGMGLALVEQFARVAGGALQLRSAAGSGTAAALYLPAIAARAAATR
ncbi:MAG TPA: ATP-binding protein [Gemmatimonadaceae bacterium]